MADPELKVSLYKPTSLSRIRKFNVKEKVDLKVMERNWSNKLTKSNLGKPCIICGQELTQMHHIKKIKELKSRKTLNWFTMQMAAINRKQVPLCMPHHKKLHSNQLSLDEKNLFVKGCKSLIQKNL